MIIHPLIRLVMSKPHLVGEHAQNYASLFKDEVGKVSSSLSLRIGLYAGAGVLALIGVVLVGVGLLLAAALPHDQFAAPWALFVVPLTPFLLAVAMILVARIKPVEPAFAVVKKQMESDMSMIRESSAT